ncbi:class I SAM-dependent methyltransferase [Rhodovulum visakhapatnamense]|nr:class I SAM-dependent methyltransferase [Rhodovulum visakhapatnamense]
MMPATDVIPMPRRIVPRLDGVPETLLWPLQSRAGITVQDRAFFDDPMAVEILNRIDYDFGRFGPVNHWHAVRSKYSDALIRSYLSVHPQATVLALGEGLETQFWRVDNGQVRWLCVDLPESIALRRQLLPEHPRVQELALSALDPAIFDHVDASRGLFVTAAGLVMYFTAEDTAGLLRRIADHLSGNGSDNGSGIRAEVFFDTIPPWLSRRALKGWKIDKGYVAPPMPFGLSRKGLDDLAGQVPGLEIIAALSYSDAYPERARLIALLAKLPVARNMAPMMIHGRFS